MDKNYIVQKNGKVRSEQRTISAVVEDPAFVEEVRIEGFKRGFNSLSSTAAKIIDLGFAEFKKLPVTRDVA